MNHITLPDEVELPNLNPYQGLTTKNATEAYRFNSLISREDYNLLKDVSPQWGTVQTVINIIFKSIVNELRELGIDTYNPVLLRRIVERRANIRLNQEASIGDVQRRTSPVQHTPSNCPDVPPESTEGSQRTPKRRRTNPPTKTKTQSQAVVGR